MNQFVVFSLLLLVASAVSQANSEIDWSKVYPRSALDKTGNLINPSESSPKYVRAEGKISDGNEAPPNSFPYVAALIVRFSSNDASCQGAIISSTTILTAAYCIDGSFNTEVIAGAHNIFHVEPTQQRRIVTPNNYRIHPNYNGGTATHNIATLLFNSLILGGAVNTAILPSGSLLQSTFVGEHVFVAGWGNQDGVLRYASQPILSNTQCAQFAPWFTADHICLSTTGGSGSPCSRDDGAPALLYNSADGSYRVLIGMFGFLGHNSCDLGHPVALVRITSYMSWIQQNWIPDSSPNIISILDSQNV